MHDNKLTKRSQAGANKQTVGGGRGSPGQPVAGTDDAEKSKQASQEDGWGVGRQASTHQDARLGR